ncbi:bifunctional phosphoribosylaminoimidazolecarboxamide formyltransferase/IMP cyclohydrolase [Euzebya tangerina]|uniref:bifunctional phosphoribosylaminoimidazolecarboxamide formyltransferase/IMP cyclohydrolase n=1 Tax=Euzebya tangerina TaxID=591198 RepID=UPI000E314FE8|nr:bifunctional phosphoribosylaminoimidazolecarboxamide formyltransferase/IMP cyclohydrolase [Euzebya tangerina]
MTPDAQNTDVTQVRRALISVYDKTGLEIMATSLFGAGVEIVSTGSTAARIRSVGIEVTEVADVTGSPEMMDGRVKTLHPAIHGGILADRDNESHRQALDENGITPVDLVVVNLYPFRDTVADPDVTPAAAIEMIDIGGPTMVRAAAKNHRHVGVVTSPAGYEAIIAEINATGGLSGETRRNLAAQAFAHTASYDADVSAWFARDVAFPERHGPVYAKAHGLRYGENPHQGAAYYVERGQPWGLGSATVLGGKELSYNNILDTDAALGMALDFDDPCIAIIKHTNPAGLAVADTLAAAYPLARAGDPVSVFGGIVAANRTIDRATAEQIVEVFTEVVVAPGFDDDALHVLRGKKNLRILAVERPTRPGGDRVIRSVSGGLLVQEPDSAPETPDTWTTPTQAKPDEATLAELAFAWTVCKHVKSNGIVLTSNRAVVGVGAGQMSRVDSVNLAVAKSEGRHEGSVLASDAFFPFRDGPDAAMDAGVRAIVQPGGSVRDDEVVAACNERGIPMVFTGRRHFRH